MVMVVSCRWRARRALTVNCKRNDVPRLALFARGRVFLLAAVAAGAFGAHALDRALAPDAMASGRPPCNTTPGTRSRCSPSASCLLQKPGERALAAVAWLLAAGIVLFSGSLYALALTGVRGFGRDTPFGGVALLAGWATLAWAAWRW